MCIFHVRSKTDSFKRFLRENPDLPVYRIYEKGEKPSVGFEGDAYEDYGFSCEVSDREWDDVAGQVVDMISFLEVYSPYLAKLKEMHNIDDWRFDLPYECRLNGELFTQCDYLPPRLMYLAGALEIGVELSLYWATDEEDEDDEGEELDLEGQNLLDYLVENFDDEDDDNADANSDT